MLAHRRKSDDAESIVLYVQSGVCQGTRPPPKRLAIIVLHKTGSHLEADARVRRPPRAANVGSYWISVSGWNGLHAV